MLNDGSQARCSTNCRSAVLRSKLKNNGKLNRKASTDTASATGLQRWSPTNSTSTPPRIVNQIIVLRIGISRAGSGAKNENGYHGQQTNDHRERIVIQIATLNMAYQL